MTLFVWSYCFLVIKNWLFLLSSGMSDLCSPMIILLEDEADAFWCFEHLMRRLVKDHLKLHFYYLSYIWLTSFFVKVFGYDFKSPAIHKFRETSCFYFLFHSKTSHTYLIFYLYELWNNMAVLYILGARPHVTTTSFPDTLMLYNSKKLLVLNFIVYRNALINLDKTK